MKKEDRGRVWRLYGWFSALMACGSCVGTVSSAARMMFFFFFLDARVSPDRAQQTSLGALAYNWFNVFLVTYGIEVLCSCAATIMVLDRMSAFAAPQGTRLLKWWTVAGRTVMVCLVLGNSVGLAANVAAAVHLQKVAVALSTASAFYAANNTQDGDGFSSLSKEESLRGTSIVVVQLYCENAVRLLIVIAYVAAGVLSSRRVTLALREVEKKRAVQKLYNPGQAEPPFLTEASIQGRSLRLRVVGTTAFIFVAFVVSLIYSFISLVAQTQVQTKCRSCDASCSDGALFAVWIEATAEFEYVVLILGSPLALLVALWGMTPNATLRMMTSNEREEML